MKRIVCGLVAMTALVGSLGLMVPGAEATGSRFHNGPAMMPKITLLSRSFRWKWDPFRVDGDKAYAVAWITNPHDYALTLNTYCRADGKQARSLSGRHLIAPGRTFLWDTRRLLRESGDEVNGIVNCRFWVDGSIDLRGQIVNLIPARMGQQGESLSLITFNYADLKPGPG